MILSTGNILLFGSILLFAGILGGKVSGRFGTPMLLFFLLVGMLFGTDGIGIEFNNFASTQCVGMVALSVILFSGGMDTSFSDIKPVLKEGIERRSTYENSIVFALSSTFLENGNVVSSIFTVPTM